MSWAEERRANQAAAREQDRLDLAAAATRQAEAVALAVELEAARKADDDARRLARIADADRRRQLRHDRRTARRAAVGRWVSEHAVEALVYPLAGVAAAMAVPAMASFGVDLFGATGYGLPAISELGSWTFAFAVQTSRRRHPDRPTAMLTFGIGVFATVGAALNLAHGLTAPGGSVVHGLAMAVVSVAGIVAHQLVVAAPPRSRADRDAARLDRLTRRRLARARKAAARRAVVALAADGSVALLHAPGRFTVHRGKLRPAVLPGLPVAPGDDWDAALADLLDDPEANPTTEADLHKSVHAESGDESDAESAGGPGRVALADPPEPTGQPIDPQARRRLTPDQARRAALRLARRKGRPVTADELRRELGIAAKTARELRDAINAEVYPNGGAT